MNAVGLGRIDQLRALLTAQNLDALIVSNPTNIRYLTGFTGSNGTAIVTPLEVVLITDQRYTERADDELAAARDHVGAEVTVGIAPGAGHPELERRLRAATAIGLEAETVSWANAVKLHELLGSNRVHSTSGLVEQLREFKSPAEIDLMRRAAAIADDALGQVIAEGIGGLSEKELQRRLDQNAVALGAHGASFDTIVASGPNGSRPHHEAGDRVIAMGDLVIIDFGAEVDGYRSDMTRSFVLGVPTNQQRSMLDAVKAAQQAGVEAVELGRGTAEIDQACRATLSRYDLEEFFTHGTGHGVGLDIHESPSVSSNSTATIAPGHVITVEPGVYIPNVGGVRFEDTVVVTTDGVETLTQSPKQPFI